MANEDGLSRRRLINWLLSLGSGSLLGVLLYPIIRYVTPADQPEAAVGTAVVRLTGGELRAFSAVCTHLGCTVQYRKDLELIWCPCHNGRFDLTGRNVAGPPPRPLEAFEVAVRGDQVVVSRRA